MNKQNQVLPINPLTGEVVPGYEVIKIKPKSIYNTMKHKSFIIMDHKILELYCKQGTKHLYILFSTMGYLDSKTNMLIYNNQRMTAKDMTKLCNCSISKVRKSIAYWESQNIMVFYHGAYHINPFYFQNGNIILTEILELFTKPPRNIHPPKNDDNIV